MGFFLTCILIPTADKITHDGPLFGRDISPLRTINLPIEEALPELLITTALLY